MSAVQDRRSYLASGWRPYAISLAAVGAAVIAAIALRAVTSNRLLPLFFFFAAVAVSAAIAGVRAGVTATVLSALVCDFFFLTPLYTLAVARADVPLLAVFVLVAAMFNGLSSILYARLEAGERRVRELNAIIADASSTLELHDMLAIVSRHLGNNAEIAGGAFCLTDDSEHGFTVKLTWGCADQRGDFVEHTAALLFSASECNGPVDAPPQVVSLATDGSLAVPLLANRDLQGWLLVFVRSQRPLAYASVQFYEMLGRQVGMLIQNSQLYGQVRSSRSRLQQLSGRLVNLQESEHREFARELHDEIGQNLTALRINLDMVSRASGVNVRRGLEEPLALLTELMNRVSELSLDLRPAMLDDLGLLPALLWQFDRLTSQTGVVVRFEHNGIDRRFSRELETTGYRIVQEALTNVTRHAGVKEAHVQLWVVGERLEIQVADNGNGFEPAEAFAARAGGLTGMQERARLMGGHLSIESKKGEGTTILADLPLDSGPGECTGDHD